MRTLEEIKPDLEKLIMEYKSCQKGNNKVRFVLCNAFKLYWLILEINTVIENE